MGNPTTFTDDSAITARSVEVPGAAWGTGGDWAGSNAHGLGINTDGGEVVGTAEQFTLLDQNEAPRTPQASSQIGNTGFVDRSTVPWPGSGGAEGIEGDPIRAAEPSASGDGGVVVEGNSTLASLAAGWTAVP